MPDPTTAYDGYLLDSKLSETEGVTVYLARHEARGSWHAFEGHRRRRQPQAPSARARGGAARRPEAPQHRPRHRVHRRRRRARSGHGFRRRAHPAKLAGRRNPVTPRPAGPVSWRGGWHSSCTREQRGTPRTDPGSHRPPARARRHVDSQDHRFRSRQVSGSRGGAVRRPDDHQHGSGALREPRPQSSFATLRPSPPQPTCMHWAACSTR